MKRKRNSEQQAVSHLLDTKTCDLILTDAQGRSIKVHRGLLMDKSDYFAQLLEQNNFTTLHLDEKYLIELIHYLYRYETASNHDRSSLYQDHGYHQQLALTSDASRDGVNMDNQPDNLQRIMNGDLEILMNLLVLCNKYGFEQLHRDLMVALNLSQLKDQTKIMILSWLPRLIHSQGFLELPEKAIYDIFNCEPSHIDSECKLAALSAWWSKNQDADMTNLWMDLITCNYND